ncbi:MAG: CpaD family pilus assembly lipoprotein [Alphaproteobacteria bacterium]|nr:CpaD family pilus assembly lipoprotein [Alphaproteobacteria bacterium]
MTKQPHRFCLAFGLLALASCDSLYPPAYQPDLTIHVVPSEKGNVAVAPKCANWKDNLDVYPDNVPYPQFGCSNAQNLAALVDEPKDLVEGRPLDASRSVLAVGAVRRYDNNQTRGLIMPVSDTSQPAATTSATGASTMTGDVTASGAKLGVSRF